MTAIMCFRYGKPGHTVFKFKYFIAGIVCPQCGKSGHILRVCRNEQKGTVPKDQSRPLCQMQEEENKITLFK